MKRLLYNSQEFNKVSKHDINSEIIAIIQLRDSLNYNQDCTGIIAIFIVIFMAIFIVTILANLDIYTDPFSLPYNYTIQTG